MSTKPVRLTMYCYNIMKGIKKKRGHSSMDSAFRELLRESDIDEEEMIRIAKSEKIEDWEDLKSE